MIDLQNRTIVSTSTAYSAPATVALENVPPYPGWQTGAPKSGANDAGILGFNKRSPHDTFAVMQLRKAPSSNPHFLLSERMLAAKRSANLTPRMTNTMGNASPIGLLSRRRILTATVRAMLGMFMIDILRSESQLDIILFPRPCPIRSLASILQNVLKVIVISEEMGTRHSLIEPLKDFGRGVQTQHALPENARLMIVKRQLTPPVPPSAS
jgi:hypothetical protein